MKLSFAVAAASIAALSGCASAPEQPPELPAAPQRITQQGYSLMPFDEHGWVVGPRDQYRLTLGKYGAHPDETFAIQGIVSQLPEFNSAEEFLRIVKEGQAADTDSERFTILQHDVVLDTSKNAQCARSHLIAEDRSAVTKTAKADAMILEAATLTCAHPGDKRVGVHVLYSHWHHEGQSDPAFMEKADQLMRSVEFEDL